MSASHAGLLAELMAPGLRVKALPPEKPCDLGMSLSPWAPVCSLSSKMVGPVLLQGLLVP